MISVGVDLGGTKALAVRIDGSATVASTTVQVDSSVSTLDAICQAVASVFDDTVEVVGIGVAGLVDHSEGMLLWGPHTSGTRLDIRAQVTDTFGVATSVDNDANTAAYGELKLGAATGYHNVLMVTLGTGIGGAIIVDESIYRGGGFAGEWGHVQIERDGLLCDCGKHGCWETRASGPALARLALQLIESNPNSSLLKYLDSSSATGETVVAAADAGDETARALVTEVGRSFGEGLAGLAAILDPELIVVGGGLGSVGEAILEPARRVLADSLPGAGFRIPPAVQVATLGRLAGAVGAALLAKDELL